MAFECQKDTQDNLGDTSTNHLDSSQVGKAVPEQLGLTGNRKLEPLGSENLQGAFGKLGIHSADPFFKSPRSFVDLPPALVSEILNFLDPKELGTISCVNTSLYKLASEHHVWKEFYSERWGHPVNSIGLAQDDKSWKELFVERDFRSKTFMGRYSIDTLYGHTEAVRTVFVLVSKKLVFTSGYDQVVRMWDMEEGRSIASSRPLGCTIRAVAADSRLLVAGGTDGFIHGWHAHDENPNLFDISSPPHDQNTEFRLWEHVGPITCLALDFNRIYSGSWDMTVRLWDRASLKCLKVLMHNDWVWSLVPHETTIGSTAGSSVHIWETNTGNQLVVINGAHGGNVYSLARSHTGKLLFSGGEDGSIHMFEITGNSECKNARKIATWIPHTGPVHSLAFEFPWLVSASSDGRISLIDVRGLLKTKKRFSTENADSRGDYLCQKNVEPPQRMLHGFGCNLFSVGIGFDRIVCGGEEGVVRIWNFSQALDIEQRVRALRGKRIENRMRRRRIQQETNVKGNLDGQCSFAAKKNLINGNKNEWHSKRRVSGKGR
ncbi:F-box/WD-40 repeat-containing protein [Striga hermonthica]|uniref:F-box/WD-40 repeat-containing protein n=1 Tax=Striga hermonthica TaxID=68872 RepID=A0A9N7MX81_STRHE|nr:F-box/WD-40 repeat-containing protein [Striga hermonthica]